MFILEAFPESQSSPAAVCSWGPNRLDVFWRGDDGLLKQRTWAHDASGVGRWGTWSFNVRVPEHLAACSWGPNRIDLFWWESREAIHHRWWDGNRWVDDPPIPAVPGRQLTACSWGPNRIDLFWQDGSSRLRQKWWDGRSWNNDGSRDVQMSSDPAACSWGPNRIDLFWREPGGGLHHSWWDGNGWNEGSLGTRFIDTPAACCWAPNVIDVFVRMSDNKLMHKWWDQGWHDWIEREGVYTTAPAVASWGDGRIDLFAGGTDGKMWHGWYQGQPLATQSDAIFSMWRFIKEYSGSDKIQRLLNSFPAGILNGGGCSGAMISPHIFITGAHCGGPGYVGSVQFYHIDQAGVAADDRSQRLSAPYPARTLPWTDGGPGVPGDVQLWLLSDDANGVPPGIRYGYQDLSDAEVSVGTEAYSFWSNPAQRLPVTLLYSVGRATSRETGDWLGPFTRYDLWGASGASGSTLLSPNHSHRVIGTTQGSEVGGARWRSVPDASIFLREYDADRSQVLDAIEYDWLITKPVQDFYLFLFNSAFERARWIVAPNGSAVAVTERGYYLSGSPRMVGRESKTDGYWEQFARFRPMATLRLSLVARGSRRGSGQSYVKFRSDTTGHEVRFNFSPQADGARYVGRVTLDANPDYRLILGTDPDTDVEIQSLSIAAEGRDLGFGTHDERRSWEYAPNSYPVSLGVRDARGFAGAVVGPEPNEWSLRNRNLGLEAAAQYRVQFDTRARVWPADGRPLLCRISLQRVDGSSTYEYVWDHPPGSGPISHDIRVISEAGSPPLLAFRADNSGVFLMDKINIERV